MSAGYDEYVGDLKDSMIPQINKKADEVARRQEYVRGIEKKKHKVGSKVKEAVAMILIGALLAGVAYFGILYSEARSRLFKNGVSDPSLGEIMKAIGNARQFGADEVTPIDVGEIGGRGR